MFAKWGFNNVRFAASHVLSSLLRSDFKDRYISLRHKSEMNLLTNHTGCDTGPGADYKKGQTVSFFMVEPVSGVGCGAARQPVQQLRRISGEQSHLG